MEKGNLKKLNIPFTQVSNVILNDERLSFRAKGVFAYLYSKPNDWNFSVHRIPKDATDGRHSVISGIKELEECGYLERKRRQDGRVDYILRHNRVNSPNTENQQEERLSEEKKSPDTENPQYRKSPIRKISTISNKDQIVIKSNSNKDPNAPPNGDILKDILQEEENGIKYDYQFLGLEIFEKLNAPKNKKAECIRLAKVYPKLINPALSFAIDYHNEKLRWKMFIWKLNELRKNEKTK